MAKDRRSKDQKRKAKLAERAKRNPARENLAYEGKKYQAERWELHVAAVELAVYDTIVLSNRRLTNAQVEAAFTQLIHGLRQGKPAVLEENEPDQDFSMENAVEYLMWNIRREWMLFQQKHGPAATSDLVGILRTLLHSIEAHAWNTGPDRGYVDFLYGFINRIS